MKSRESTGGPHANAAPHIGVHTHTDRNESQTKSLYLTGASAVHIITKDEKRHIDRFTTGTQ